MNYKEEYKIAQLIYRELIGTLSLKDWELLDEWKKANELKYHRILSEVKLQKEYDLYSKTNYISAQSDMEKRIRLSSRQNGAFSLFLRIAAVLILAVGILWIFYPKSNLDSTIADSRIIPGESKALLTLGDGTIIPLDSFLEDTIAKHSGTLIMAKGAEVNYSVEDNTNASQEIDYNFIDIPRGGEYKLTLADGTRVWLNSQTKLKFPVKFSCKERKVFLEGEAYFKVAHNKDKPFRVEINGQVVEVLGTSFNISSYEEEGKIFTTLVEGKVKVLTSNNNSIQLTPGEQSIFSVNSEKINKRKVDVTRYTAWKDGKFVLNNQTLEQIMEKMSRWYNINIFYINPEVKDIVYKGVVQKYGEFNSILNILEKTGEVRFRIKGNTVIISKEN